METRARYVVIGLFTLGAILGGFLFVYWLQSGGGLRRQAIYQIRFESPVSGLVKGLGRSLQRHPCRRGDRTQAQCK
jgi:phospholipid/cholesterol/gamma-HCH transport system substrate-binding protein